MIGVQMHRFLRILSIALITAGLVVMVDVGLTLAWKEPLSSIYGSIRQGEAEDQLADLEEELPQRRAAAQGAQRGRALRARRGARRRVRAGGQARRGDRAHPDPADRPRRGHGRGHRHGQPAAGPGPLHARPTATAARGRRRRLGVPRPGRDDGRRRATGPPTWPRSAGSTRSSPATRSSCRCPTGRSPTRSQGHEIVDPNDVSIVENKGYDRLVLTACHPLYSAAQRYAQFAKLTDVSLFAAGDRRWQDP